MSLFACIRLSAVLAASALTSGFAFAQHHGGGHGGHVGGAHHMGGAHMGGVHHYGGTHYYGTHHHHGGYYGGGYYGGLGYGGIGIGLGYGLGYGGLYSPLSYGLGGYSSYGGLGYGSLGYGYGYPSTYRYAAPAYGTPAIPGTYYPQYQAIPPAQPDPNVDPMPLPLPAPNGTTPNATPDTTTLIAGNTATAKITVLANEGAKVSFDGIASEQTGTRHSFTTKPISKNAEQRVQVKVDGSTISIGVRGGESATIDMRK